MYKVGIITASDKGYAGQREDLSGPSIEEIIRNFHYFEVTFKIMLPDEMEILSEQMKVMVDEYKLDLILTTGGTGFSKRDVTPEATKKIIEREAPGITEAMRYLSLQITPRAMLSRAVAGIRGNSLIVNMPGSPKAIKETLDYILPSIKHGIDILQGNDSDCASS